MRRLRVAAALLMIAGLPLAGARPGAAPQNAQGQSQAQTASQPQAPQPGIPTIRGGIDLVRVDVFVTDRKGAPVTDLTEADFEVLDDNAPQEIDQFRVVRIDTTRSVDLPSGQQRSFTDEEVRTLDDDSRLFVFFLDDYHTRDRNAVAIRDTLTQFIRTLRPTDLVAIMYPLWGLDDVVFTRNHDSIVGAIQRFEGRKYDYTPRNAYEQNMRWERMSTPDLEHLRNRIVQGAIEGLAMKLGSLREERKAVILVSEGFTVTLPAGMRRQNAGAPQLPGAGSDPRIEADAEIKGFMDLELRMRDVYRAANRFNTAIYTLDPRGLTPFEFDISDGAAGGIPLRDDAAMLRTTQDTLRAMAEATDGRAILNRNSLAEGLSQIVRDSSFYYLLGYTQPPRNDGKFHQIKVRVTRPDVNVRARRGYWALTTETVTRLTTPRTPEAPRPVTQALATLAAPTQVARFVRTWVGTEQGRDGKTKVTLVWEPLPLSAPVRREQAGRVSVLAATETGDLVYRGRSPDAAAAGSAAAATAVTTASPAAHRVTFEAPPGKLELRLTIEAAGGGTLDNENRTIDIPDLTTGAAALSTPRVFRARTGRDFQAVAQDAAAVPAAAREFSRTERLLVRFDAYAASGETPVTTAAVLNRAGDKVADVPVTAATVGGTHQLDVALNTFAAGEYVLAVTVTGASGEAATEYVAFRIGA
jgi:VWFA-related protein